MPLMLMIDSYQHRCEGFGPAGHENTLCGDRTRCARHMALATDPFDRPLPKRDRCCKPGKFDQFLPVPGGWK